MFTLTKTLPTTHESKSSFSHALINSENLFFLETTLDADPFNLVNNVDVVYIDPPYNTGNTDKTGFTYNDSFARQEWLTFMEERIVPVKKLLKPTGVIIVSIDDSEVHYLRVLLDQIFGEKNFIAQLVIDGGANKNNASFFSVTHEYMLVYAQNINILKKKKIKWRQSRPDIHILLNEYEKVKKQGKTPEQITTYLKQWVKNQPLSKRLKVFYNADSKGLYTYADLSVPGNKYEYTVFHPVTGKPVAEPSRGWGLSEEKFHTLAAENMIIWGEDETKQPLKKLYLNDKKDQLMKSVLSYPSRSSTHLIEKIIGKRDSFNNPKNLQMMEDILGYLTPEDGVVLDYFAGTGTTGHAVLALNKKEKSNRRFVLVTNNENNIFVDVTQPRIEHVHKDSHDNNPISIFVNEENTSV